jgi:hypothetical protein
LMSQLSTLGRMKHSASARSWAAKATKLLHQHLYQCVQRQTCIESVMHPAGGTGIADCCVFHPSTRSKPTPVPDSSSSSCCCCCMRTKKPAVLVLQPCTGDLHSSLPNPITDMHPVLHT